MCVFGISKEEVRTLLKSLGRSRLTIAPRVKSNQGVTAPIPSKVLHQWGEIIYSSKGAWDAYDGVGTIAPDFIVDLHTIYKCLGLFSRLTTCFRLLERYSCRRFLLSHHSVKVSDYMILSQGWGLGGMQYPWCLL